MGIFSKKKSTKIENINKRITLSKIVKFSYLQTLAINGGLDNVRNIAGETEGVQTSTADGSSKNSELNNALESFDKFSTLFLGIPSLAGKVIGQLFGKKISTDTRVDTNESGWTLTKTWNQPQFDIIRYAIGIKELTIAQFTYKETSEFISTVWSSPKEIVKTTVVVDQFIPDNFPPGNYIKYYVKPNVTNAEWIQINPLGLPSVFSSTGSVVPRIINFNTEKPLSAKFEDAYIFTTDPVKDLIFRAVLSRPQQENNISSGHTPILRSYRLLMYPRDGL